MATVVWGLVAAPLVAVSVWSWLPRPSAWSLSGLASATVLLSAAVGWWFGESPVLAAWWWLAVVGSVLALIDSMHHRLPHPWLVILLLGGAVVFVVEVMTIHQPRVVVRLVAASAVVLALGLLVQWLAPGQIGFGDTLLLTVMAPFWAWYGWSTVAAGLLCAHLVLGLLAGVAWIAGSRGPEARIAAGPGLLLGAWLPLL